MSKLLLIDGSNYLFRAYHALPPLTTSRGEPSGAIKGFLGMLANVARLSKADRAAVIFDAPGKTFRHEMYPAYKANRPPMPEDLRTQIEPLQGIVRALGWPLLIVPGIEADDVIGSLSAMAARAGVDTVVATGDKDMAQLVDDHVVLLNTMNSKFYDREGVIEKYGVPPESMIAYLALMGDKVDNVPGIKSCGPKTAAKWINEIGGIDAIRAAAPTMKGKIGENLRAGLPFIDEAVALVTIKRDAVISGAETLTDIKAVPAEESALEAFCARWEISRRTLDRAQALAAMGLAPAVTAEGAAASNAGHVQRRSLAFPMLRSSRPQRKGMCRLQRSLTAEVKNSKFRVKVLRRKILKTPMKRCAAKWPVRRILKHWLTVFRQPKGSMSPPRSPCFGTACRGTLIWAAWLLPLRRSTFGSFSQPLNFRQPRSSKP